MSLLWTEKDLTHLQNHSLTQELVEQQLERFKRGVQAVVLVAACTPENGILKLSSEQVNSYAALFQRQNLFSAIKFVPASGAASRMFKHLFEHEQTNSLYQEFLQRISEFPFAAELKKKLAENELDFASLESVQNQKTTISYLLESQGLGYAHLPKGAIPFHFTKGQSLTPFEEHVNEAVAYASTTNQVRLHYTVGEAFTQELEQSLHSFAKQIEQEKACTIHISFSKQYPETDTIAVDAANAPFRNEQGEIVIRPGGHGALLSNLQALDDDIVFIKNIDNVLPSNKRAEHDLYKTALAGFLTELIDQRNSLLRSRDLDTEEGRTAMKSFMNLFSFEPVEDVSDEEVRNFLNRPIRVAGMVQNQGEPGGGPFWVEGPDGKIHRQIIEKAQINLSNAEQAKILSESTHFNPVDLVCHFKNEQGEKYKLAHFSDPNQAFVSEKFMFGKPLKALEHPGLWNGAMAKWLTLFVEVPLSTFAPVKTVNDLLREAHR